VPGEDQTIDNGASTMSLLALEALTESVVGYGGELYEVIDGRHSFEGIEILWWRRTPRAMPYSGTTNRRAPPRSSAACSVMRRPAGPIGEQVWHCGA
jgi:hypothetical protein